LKSAGTREREKWNHKSLGGERAPTQCIFCRRDKENLSRGNGMSLGAAKEYERKLTRAAPGGGVGIEEDRSQQ